MVHSNRILFYVSPLLILLLISCASSRDVNIERGTGYNFQAGYPEFRTSAFGYMDEKKGSTLVVTTEIVKGSLVFKEQSDSLAAKIAMELQVLDLENSENIVATKRFEKTVLSGDQSVTNTRETLTLEQSMQVEPSRYRVIVNIMDMNSDKNLVQRVETYIPQVETGAYTLTKIQMYGKEENEKEWSPINTYDVKGRIDSLRFVFQIISEQTKQPMTINSRLLQFKSDTGYTRPMHFSNYSPSSIEYKGIDYDRETEIQSNRRKLTNYSSIFIEYKFPQQERGNYRFEVEARKSDDEPIYKARAFGVKSKNYPAIESAEELAQPLIYLMGEGDYEDMMEINDADSLKNHIDRFWLRHVGNKSKARDVIELYYQRVEEANKQFSNFKEGWKTDPGMIYILFGPPWYTEDHLKELIWYYSYNHSDPEYSYFFYQPKLKNEYYPFYHFLLQRDNYYYTVQYLQRELWLSGQILTRRI